MFGNWGEMSSCSQWEEGEGGGVGVEDEEVLRCKRSNNCHNIVENAAEHHLGFSLG